MRLRALLVALVASAFVTSPASEAAPPQAELLELVHHDLYFSPNGDGIADRSHVAFRLEHAAYVSGLVRGRDGTVVRRVSLGVRPAGRHMWRWDGSSATGEAVPDGSYRLILRAAGGGRTSRASTSTTAVTQPDAGRVVLSRPVIHPHATLVRDLLSVVYVRAGYSEDFRQNMGYYGRTLKLDARLVITAPSGERVLDQTREKYAPRFTWSARDERGRPLAAGVYRLRVTVTDEVGNRRTIRDHVEVSSRQLVEKIWSSTVAAASAELGPGPIYDAGCNGCGEVCDPVPSERYPGGLSFRQPCDFGYAAVRWFGAAPPFVPSPVDAFRVTATGGPTVAGDSDVANFNGLVMGPGDATVTTPWQEVDLDAYPYIPDARQPVTWAVSTSEENDYDVASFTVEYRYYVPAS